MIWMYEVRTWADHLPVAGNLIPEKATRSKRNHRVVLVNNALLYIELRHIAEEQCIQHEFWKEIRSKESWPIARQSTKKGKSIDNMKSSFSRFYQPHTHRIMRENLINQKEKRKRKISPLLCDKQLLFLGVSMRIGYNTTWEIGLNLFHCDQTVC